VDFGQLLDPKYDPYSGLRASIESFGINVSQTEPLVLVGLALFGLWLMRFGQHAVPNRPPRRDLEEDIRRPSNTGFWRRLWWRLRPPHDLMRVDGLQIDRSRKPHCAWLGPTGAGKSSAVAAVRVDGKRPTLIATPDTSDPLLAATLRLDGFVWTACSSSTPVNFLIGSPQEVAERLTEVFRSGGVGAWKRAARLATAEVIRQIDDIAEPRTLVRIGEYLRDAVASDRELKTVCAGWVARFLDLADQFGSSIGPDGVDLAELLREGRTVLLDNDSFNHAALGGDVVALALAEAKRCASLVPTGFRLIFEEAGQLQDRIDLVEPFLRAGRRRKLAVDLLTQAESDLNEGISANVATRVYFAQELKSLQKVAADRLGLDYRELDPSVMRDFSAWVHHGKIRRLVRFPRPPSIKPPAAPRTSSYGDEPTQIVPPKPYGRRIIVREVGAPGMPPHALPSPSLLVQGLLEQIDRSGECWLWLGRKDRDGYGLVWWAGQNRRAHRIVYQEIYGPIPLGADGKPLDLDHRRTCPRHCVRPDHLEQVSRSENVRRRWRVRGIAR
jgi:hypothetical protein